jgi:hypothetical protein
MTADYWLLVAPIAGTGVNLAVQLILARILAGQRLLLLVIIAFCLGFGATGAIAIFAIRLAGVATTDAFALAVSVFIVYSAAGLALFAIVNLGETSLRIRMMRMLLDTPGGVNRDDLILAYDDRALISVRLQRLQEKAQARVCDGIYYPRLSFLFVAAAGVRMLKRIIYGRG